MTEPDGWLNVASDEVEKSVVQISAARRATVGDVPVRRALPATGRRTVGAWCFADHMGPTDFTPENGLDIGPHPHTGLQTVTWLIEGEATHHDSLGSEQVITPGQLNLMSAGRGVAHSEEATGTYRGRLQGIQLWVAQPEATRHGDAAFEHHASLPMLETGGAVVTVLVGSLLELTSPARHDTELMGADLRLHGRVALPLERRFEHAVIVLEGSLAIDGTPLEPGSMGYLPTGRDEVELDARRPTSAIMLGGVPFPERIFMWWNFVARSRDEIDSAYLSWSEPDGRYGEVHSGLARIETPPPYWMDPGTPPPAH